MTTRWAGPNLVLSLWSIFTLPGPQIQVVRATTAAQAFFVPRLADDVDPRTAVRVAAGEEIEELPAGIQDRGEVSLAHGGPVVVMHKFVDRPVLAFFGGDHL